jgi:hypothetical protein
MDIDLNACDVKIINLDSRPDRWEQVKVEVGKIGVANYTRFSGITKGGVWRGSVLSHWTCVTEGSGMILILEDDVVFTDGVSDVLPRALSQLPDDFDMFYIGANVKLPAERYSDNLFRVVRGVHTNHAILFSDNARRVIKDNYNPYTCKEGWFDNWLYQVGLSMMKCFVCSPMVAFQRSGFSDVRQEQMDYYDEMRTNELKHMI